MTESWPTHISWEQLRWWRSVFWWVSKKRAYTEHVNSIIDLFPWCTSGYWYIVWPWTWWIRVSWQRGYAGESLTSATSPWMVSSVIVVVSPLPINTWWTFRCLLSHYYRYLISIVAIIPFSWNISQVHTKGTICIRRGSKSERLNIRRVKPKGYCRFSEMIRGFPQSA